MARTKQPSLLRAKIVKAASELFFENGFSKTTSSELCAKVGMGTGNLTFYFPTKEHLLAVLVKMLCNYQWRMMEQATDEGKTSLMALCLELTAMAAACEENDIARDFYLSAYTHPITLDIIRRNDARRAKQVFGPLYCQNWREHNFKEAETLVSGIEYATLMTTESSAALDVRIAGALQAVMLIYNVPEETRRIKLDKVLAMDYRGLGRGILQAFREYIEKVNEDNLRSTKQLKATPHKSMTAHLLA